MVKDDDAQTLPGIQRVQEERNRRPVLDDVVLPSPARPSPPTDALPVSLDGRNLVALEHKVAQLEQMLSRKVDRAEKLTQAAHSHVTSMLVQSEDGTLAQVDRIIKQSIGNAVKPIEELMSEHVVSVQKKLEETARRVEQVTGEGEKVKEQLAELSAGMEVLETQVLQQVHAPTGGQKQVREEIDQLKRRDEEYAEQLLIFLETQVGEVRRHLEAIKEQQAKLEDKQQTQNAELKNEYAEAAEQLRKEIGEVRAELEELRESNTQTQVPDSFYVRTLGEILGQNVEALQAGNFEQLSRQVGERLNQFFRTEVPHGDKLEELRTRTEAVHLALKNVVAQMALLNQQAADEASPHLQRVAALTEELGALQAQLQSRRLNIETTLRIPVSMHTNARQTFLEELARGIRREIDKLSEPQSHFAAELKRVITTDLISVVDICDKKIAHPGVRPELEEALNQLFAQAGLLPIMPRQGEPLKSLEHDLLQMVQGAPGKSLRIAQIVTRGFYYEEQDGKTLLRKAVVTVYR
ncbi:MAG TPA: hypothetical protein VM911_23100 [Pyrinomonadaceae bacterium]|nr:hypothetical protein [Pyrinomonadaceae bacterium]